MQNLSEPDIERIKTLHQKLWSSEIKNKGAKIHYEDWVWLVFKISSGAVQASNSDDNTLSLSCSNYGHLAVIHSDHMPDQFKNDLDKIKYVFQKLSANSKLTK